MPILQMQNCHETVCSEHPGNPWLKVRGAHTPSSHTGLGRGSREEGLQVCTS